METDRLHAHLRAAYAPDYDRDRPQAEGPFAGSAALLVGHHVAGGRDPRRPAYHQGLPRRRQDDRPLPHRHREHEEQEHSSGHTSGERAPGQRAARQRADRDSPMVRRHPHSRRPFGHRRPRVHLVHDHPLQHHPAGQRPLEGGLRHPQGPRQHGAHRQDPGGRKPHQGAREPQAAHQLRAFDQLQACRLLV